VVTYLVYVRPPLEEAYNNNPWLWCCSHHPTFNFAL
jgi:hypothetical protein